MNQILKGLEGSITGNITKAIIFVRNHDQSTKASKDEMMKDDKFIEDLRKKIAINSPKTAGPGFSSITGKASNTGNSPFLALEVQFNPNSLNLETIAGKEVDYSGGNLGNKSANQIIQIHHPASTILNFEIIFDEVNPQDAFMTSNLAPSVGNAVSLVAGGTKKILGKDSTVQPQVDGLMSLLVRDETRQIIFLWGKMFFPGELISVNSRYTMFNKSGRPIRAVVQLSIRQSDDKRFNNKEYWDQAFTRMFGKSGSQQVSGAKSTFAKVTNNNILNLNI